MPLTSLEVKIIFSANKDVSYRGWGKVWGYHVAVLVFTARFFFFLSEKLNTQISLFRLLN